MLRVRAMSVAMRNDADLVGESRSGDRDAFGQIVSRYQSLICSLAYSATGSLSQSEDLAQETFVAAWQRLAELREPEKLRAWLCGIARNLIHNFLRRQGREPSHHAEPLEEIAENPSPEPLPAEHAVSNEEAELLWRSLGRIPENYREPLILFYREHQSVEAVARELDLSEDAVKQRLSRGRKLLQEQVLAFVEDALVRTNPGKAFTIAVLASVPGLAVSAKAATVGATAATGGATAKAAGATGLLGALLGPLAVILPSYLGYRVALAGAQSQEERRHVRMLFRKAGVVTLALFIPFAALVLWISRNQRDPSFLSGLFAAGLLLIYLPAIRILGTSGKRRKKLAAILAQKHASVFPKPAWEYRSTFTLFGLPLVHIRIGDRFSLLKKPVKAWIAIGDRAVGGLFAFGSWAIAPLSIGGFSIGALSLGGLSAGIFALGGIAVGLWTFLGLCIGWQSVGCVAIAWKAAAGNLALAHNFAHGPLAFAAQVNDHVTRQFFESSSFYHWAMFILVNNHWLWLNLLWIIPFLVLWGMAWKTKTKTGSEC